MFETRIIRRAPLLAIAFGALYLHSSSFAFERLDCEPPFGLHGGLIGARFSPQHPADLGAVVLRGVLADPRSAARAVSVAARYRVTVSTADGRPIQVWEGEAFLPAGEPVELRLPWGGADRRGHLVPAGLYLARFEAWGVTQEPHPRTFESPFTDELAIVVEPGLSLAEARTYRHPPSLDAAGRVNAPHEPIPYSFYYGNPHSHSTRSDGGGSATGGSCTASTTRPEGAYPHDAFAIAASTGDLDWLMVSEHNHLIDNADPHDSLPPNNDSSGIYAQGRDAADAATSSSFVGIYGMEWGTISGCGHVDIYDAPGLMNWEAGHYDILTAACTYAGSGGLYDVAAQAGSVSPATRLPHLVLNHPSDNDMFGSYARDSYADNAVRGVAVVSGSSISCATNFPSGGTSSTSTYKNRLIKLLDAGWRVAPEAHQDNHGDNYGSHSEIRTVIVSEKLSRPCLLQAQYDRRVYATQDRDGQLIFTATAGNGVPHHMGEEMGGQGGVDLHVSWWDPGNDPITLYRLLRGEVGAGNTAFSHLDVVATGFAGTPTGAETIDVSDDPGPGTFYYLVEIQQPGSPNVRHTVSAPIWIDFDTVDAGVTPPACLPAAAPSASPASGCGEVVTTLSANPWGGVPPYSYAWTPTTGLSDPNAENPTATVSSTTVYSVVVTDDSGAPSSAADVTVTVDPGPAPAAPTVAAAGGPASITLAWSATLGTGTYEIHRSSGSCASPAIVHSQSAALPPAWSDVTVVPGVVYCYTVVADDGSCDSGPSGCGPASCAVAGSVPEVSPVPSSEPLTLTRSGSALQVRFAWQGPGLTYHLYAADDDASIAAGAWDAKYCDLASSALGTFATDGASWVTFTLPDIATFPTGNVVVIAEDGGLEGPYGFTSLGGLRPADADATTADDRGCATAPCASELFISEYVEGSSNNKAVEIVNLTGAAVAFSGEYELEFYFNGNTSAGNTIVLSGSVADGDVHVVADDGSSAGILAVADQTDTGIFFNGDDAVVLRRNGNVIDAIGQVGFDPGSQWGSGLQSTQDNTLRRMATVLSGDTDETDAFDPSLEWDGYAQDDIDDLGSHGASCP